jgi:hypothetical protein
MSASGRGAVLVWVLTLVLVPASPALAHSDDNYWFAEWRSQSRGSSDQKYEFTQQVPGDGNGNFADRVADGAKKWNDIAISGSDMHFVRNGVVSNYNPWSCPTWYRNGVHYRTVPDFDAAAFVCRSWDGQYYVNSFQVIFDPDPSPGGWYVGVDWNNQGPGESDVFGFSAHEFGHVSGGWSENWTPQGHFDPGANPNLCFNPSGPWADHHTMCKNTPPAGPSQGWVRSLEAHDIHHAGGLRLAALAQGEALRAWIVLSDHQWTFAVC